MLGFAVRLGSGEAEISGIKFYILDKRAILNLESAPARTEGA
jgi:hypothetical protein